MTVPESFRERLGDIGEAGRDDFTRAHAARETGLRAAREAVQLASRSIRAAHRGEFDQAEKLWREAGAGLHAAAEQLGPHPAVYNAGFMRDAEKEYAEAAITLALISGTDIPTAGDLKVGHPAFLNGLAEAASELRRSALDAIRRGDVARAGHLLDLMDEVFAILETIDFPEGVTGGLRRRMDQLRGVLERTRGDVTQALRQSSLERRMAGLERRLTGGEDRLPQA